MIPSPTDLTYFIEVAQALNLSRAAESLNISQPSLTLAMKRLEMTLGTLLLNRHKRGVTLTKAGKQLLTQTRILLEQWQLIKSKTLASQHDIQGLFTIGCPGLLGERLLPQFLPGLMHRYPNLEIKLIHDASKKITESVINMTIDIGLVVNPARYPDLVIKKLTDDKFTVWGSDKKTPAVLIGNSDLMQTQFILKSLKKKKNFPMKLLECNKLEVIARLTQQGCGYGILPSCIATQLQLIPQAKAPVYLDEVCLIYRGENRSVKAMQVLIEAIKSVPN